MHHILNKIFTKTNQKHIYNNHKNKTGRGGVCASFSTFNEIPKYEGDVEDCVVFSFAYGCSKNKVEKEIIMIIFK